MLNLQDVINQAHGCEPLDLSREWFDEGVALGPGITCVTGWSGDQPRVEYRIWGQLAATAYLDQDLAARVDVESACALGPVDVLLLMCVLNLANSRASQMAYAMNRPVVRTK